MKTIVKDNESQKLADWNKMLRLGAEIYNHLPYRQYEECKMYLAVFAAMLTGNSGTKIYYAGDFDPEGMLIAQKLSQYYKGEFYYWHMKVEDYELCKSKETISSRRMKTLERITDERLKPVAEAIKKYGTAGYQERLTEVL